MNALAQEQNHAGISTFELSLGLDTDGKGNKVERAKVVVRDIFERANADELIIQLLNFLYVEDPYANTSSTNTVFATLESKVLDARGIVLTDDGFRLPRSAVDTESVASLREVEYRMVGEGSYATVQRYVDPNHGKTAMRDNYLQRSPLDGISKPKRSTEPRAVFTKHEIQQVLHRLRGTPHWPIFTLIALTGLRVGEALALKWRDIDEESGVLTVSRTLTSVGAKLALGSPKTDRGARKIPVNPAALRAVLNYVRDHDHQRVVITAGTPNDFIFRTANNTFLDPHNVLRALRLVRDALSLNPKLTTHSIRHYAATQMFANKVDARSVADILGHSDPGFTLRRYTHPDLEMLRTGTDALADVFDFDEI